MENYGVDGICLSSYSLDLCLSISVFESVWRTTRIMVMMMMREKKKRIRDEGGMERVSCGCEDLFVHQLLQECNPSTYGSVL